MTQTNTDNRTEERRNRFSGESYMLTPAEAIKHDRIFIKADFVFLFIHNIPFYLLIG